MEFHMHLLPTYFPGQSAPFARFYQEVLEEVQLAEELGWTCFWFTEHHFLPYGGAIPSPAVFMAGAAARTSTIHLGSAISILPLHNPIQIAEDYAMVDVVSRGRLEFGMGIGNTAVDFRVYGVPREESRARFDEAAEIILKVWRNERASHDGAFWQFEELAVYPRPVQRPHPPLWVAGRSPDSLGWAGRNGCNIMTVAHSFTAESYGPGMEAWREGLVEAGYDPAERHCKLHLRVWVDEDAERAREVAEEAIAQYEHIATVGRERGIPSKPASEYDWEGMLAAGRNAYGTPEQCIRAIQNTVRNYDFDILSTTFNYGGLPHDQVMTAMRLFAQEVMPAFK